MKTLLTLAALIPFIFFTACPNPVDNNTPGEHGVTYTVTANGDANTTTTALAFSFSEAVSGLAADNITISGSGVTKGALTGGGTSWSLALTVSTAGNVTVAIAKDGIENGQKSVAVYVAGQGQPVPETVSWMVTADGDANTTTTALAFTFSEAVSGLTAEDINITSEDGVEKGELTGGGTNWSLALTVSMPQNITVAIAKDRIESGQKPVKLYVAGQDVPFTTYTVTANGNANTTTTALTFTFSEAVSGLTLDDINMSLEEGNVILHRLEGGGKDWSLALTVGTAQNIKVAIVKAGIESGQKPVKLYVEGQAAPLIIWTVTADGDENTPTTALHFTFSEAVSGLTADDITISENHYGGYIEKGVLTGNGTSWSLALFVEGDSYWGDSDWTSISVVINKDGIENRSENGSDSVLVYPQPTTATYEVTADGDANTTTTELTFDFSKLVYDLTADDITISGSGVTKGELRGGYATWRLTLTVDTAQNITVTIAKDGIESGPKLVTVYVEDQPVPPTTYTVTANGNANTTTTALAFTFSEAVSGLTANDIVITRSEGGVTKGALTGSGTSWSLALVVDTTQDIWVWISKDGIESVEQRVKVYVKPPVRYDVAADGHAQTMRTTALTFTFSEAVSGLTADDITINGSGVTKGALTGGGTRWSLALTVSTTTGITAAIAKDGIESEQKTVNVYAPQYTVTFSAGGGSGSVPGNQTKYVGEQITLPGQGSMTPPAGKFFGGWESGGTSYQEGHTWTVSADVTFTARWMTPPVPDNLSLADSLAWISSNAIDGGDYTITLKGNETIAPHDLIYYGKNVSITLTGGAAERTVSLSGKGSLFTVDIGETLILGNNVTLQGLGDNNAPLVKIGSAGTLEMNAGSKISGNTADYGVYVRGTFTMNGGEISGNTASSSGGGVFVSSGGTFTMNGGEISGNTTSGDGGGVCVGGTFTMNGGTISNNIANNNGGGVYVSVTFTMNGGTISGNTASSSSNGYGGGVYVYNNHGTFTKGTGGTIYGQDAGDVALRNTAKDFNSGHAVYVSSSKYLNSTAGNGVTLDSKVSEAAGGWGDTVPGNLPLEEALEWFSGNRITNTAYTITLNKDETIAPSALSTSNSVSITIRGDTVERTISLSETGSLFTVERNVALILDSNITLQGRIDNTASLVRVNSGGTLEMNAGSKITGNTSSASSGGGVFVVGSFTMNGGEISGNTADNGGGVCVHRDGRFTMNDGTISGNTASDYGGGVYVVGRFTMNGGTISRNSASSGGGVYVSYDGTFTMNNGTISNNIANNNGGGVYVVVTFTMNGGTISNNIASSDGGGVYGSLTMSGGTISGNSASSGGGVYDSLTMSGGTISNNIASSDGGGVYVSSSGTFVMNDGTISDNTASGNGGGVYYVGTFMMSVNGGTISNNIASGNGGGVYVSSDRFDQMIDGTISGNTASGNGGGVYLDSNCRYFYKFGGIIYGSEETSTLKNTATNGDGHAVYVDSSPVKKRNTTAGQGDTLLFIDDTSPDSDEGWED